MNKTHVLLVCANPRGSDPLRTGEEDRILRESLRLSPHRENFDVETLNAATIDDVRRALLRRPAQIVHFSGHGTPSGLVFEDSAGKLMVPPSAALAELLQRKSVRVALFNACYSLSVGKISAVGLDYTIASSGPISDPGAIEFSRGFYDALGAGTDVPDAFAEGLSAARLKGLTIDAVLLRKGEHHVAPAVVAAPADPLFAERPTIKSLLGIAVDVSGSMRDSIQNRSGAASSRFSEVKDAVTAIGAQVRDDLKTRAPGVADTFAVFLYGFGVRMGNGVVDLGSLWSAARRLDLAREIEVRRQHYEAEARSQASQYAGLASLARSSGYGHLVDSMTDAAAAKIREKIVGDVSSIVLEEARRIGDTTLSPEALAALFDEAPATSEARLLDHVLFGGTPMSSAATEIRDRFSRFKPEQFDNRTLLVISDGESSDGDPTAPVREIRDSGVTIVACFVTSDDVANPRVLYGAPLPTWTTGARLMWDIASPVDEAGPAARFLLSNGWSIERNARLFVQANHSDVLKEFARVGASQFTREGTSMLPRGQ